MTAYYIGLMSGTSVDSIDGVLVSFDTPLTRRSASTSPASGRGGCEELFSLPFYRLREKVPEGRMRASLKYLLFILVVFDFLKLGINHVFLFRISVCVCLFAL